MTLGEYVKKYRTDHHLSIRDFSAKSGLSNQYISLIERGVNNGGKSMSPTIETFCTIAKAIDMDETQLFAAVNDKVNIAPEISDHERTIIDMMRTNEHFASAVNALFNAYDNL